MTYLYIYLCYYKLCICVWCVDFLNKVPFFLPMVPRGGGGSYGIVDHGSCAEYAQFFLNYKMGTTKSDYSD